MKKSKAFIIQYNDTPVAVVIGDREYADELMDRLSKEKYKEVRSMFNDYGEYRSSFNWHIEIVDQQVNPDPNNRGTAICRRLLDGETLREVADDYGVSTVTIYDIFKRTMTRAVEHTSSKILSDSGVYLSLIKARRFKDQYLSVLSDYDEARVEI